MEELIRLNDRVIENLKRLPNNPGIYKFLNSKKEPLYIGKAKSLDKRIKSYFSKKDKSEKKVLSLLSEAEYLVFTLTNSELEALLLEQHLITQLKPKFNVQFKDDKGYPWIKFDLKHEYPSAKSFRGRSKKVHKLYGPFPNAFAVKETLTLIQKVFKIRNCSNTFFKNRTRPCLQHEIGRCSAPCVGLIRKDKYEKEVNNAEDLLKGKGDHLIKDLYQLMDKSSLEKKYERAANYRDKLSSLREVQRKQSITGFNKDRDAICLFIYNKTNYLGVTSVRGGWIISHENFIQTNSSLDEEILESFLMNYYLSKEVCPPTVLLSQKLKNRKIVQKALSENFNKRININTRLSKKDKGLLEIATSNTKLSINKMRRKVNNYEKKLSLVSKEIDIDKDINLIESYDISHHSGENTVGVCVVYDLRGKVKEKYRTYNINNRNSLNDISSLKEVISRRYRKKDILKPDLILIDGGYTHLKAVKGILKEKGIENIELVSISKGVRRKRQMDSIHKSNGEKIKINPLLLSHNLLQEIRDETHRFAIDNLRKKRSKSSSKSLLDGFQGIGKEKKQSLLRYFGSVKQISRAGREDLLSVPGIGIKNAETIYKNFH